MGARRTFHSYPEGKAQGWQNAFGRPDVSCGHRSRVAETLTPDWHCAAARRSLGALQTQSMLLRLDLAELIALPFIRSYVAAAGVLSIGARIAALIGL